MKKRRICARCVSEACHGGNRAWRLRVAVEEADVALELSGVEWRFVEEPRGDDGFSRALVSIKQL